jgi:hypothetical protein
MVIVIATRVDLRDESVMADEVFALSPISARAVQPSEADYDAIREAFMETSRGRWFLGEYAKRNRNADTSMVLDAVARIEETLAAHRQPSTPDDRLAEALAAIRIAVDQNAEAVTATFDRAALESSLAPILKGTRIIKEISWRWREIGADGRICDLIDSQLEAIEAGCGQIVARDPRTALLAAFNEIKASIDAFADIEIADIEVAGIEGEHTTPPADQDAIATAFQPASHEIGADIAFAGPTEAEAAASEAAASAEAAMTEESSAVEGLAQTGFAQTASAEEAVIEADLIAQASGATDMPAAAVETAELAAEADHAQPNSQADAQNAPQVDLQADAHDEAVLELVAAEMSAPDPIEIDDFSDPIGDDIIVTSRSANAAGTDERMPEPVVTPVRPPIVQPFPQSSPPVSLRPAPVVVREAPAEPAIEPSLGSTIIANGLLQPAKTPANDPLAPIRRMSQAEKIAFFS